MRARGTQGDESNSKIPSAVTNIPIPVYPNSQEGLIGPVYSSRLYMGPVRPSTGCLGILEWVY